MRVLCLTSIFPNRFQPNRGIYNWRHFRLLQKHVELRVVSPVAWGDDLRSIRANGVSISGRNWTEWNGVPVIYPRYYYTPGLLRSLYGLFLKMSILPMFRKAVADFQPDVIYGCWAYPDGWVAHQLGRMVGLPVVVKVHGSDLLLLDEFPGRRRKTIEMLRDVDAISAVSDDLRTTAIKLGTPEFRSHLIHEGTDRDLFCPGDAQAARQHLRLRSDRKRLLFVGNLIPLKGIGYLLEACRLLLAEGLPIEADIVGEGPLSNALAREITAFGLADSVRLRGRQPQSELPHWYRACDLVVLPSSSEGVPNVLVEAAACGTPFVATSVGGIPEIAGLSPSRLVPFGDAVALARAIRSMFEERSAAIGVSKKQKVPTVEECADATVRLFLDVIGSTRSARNEQMTSTTVFCGREHEVNSVEVTRHGA